MATDYAANVSKVVEACLAYGCDMMFHWYECIIQNTNVSSYRWLANHSSQTEIEVRGGGGRGLAFRTTDFALFLFILNMFTVIKASISRTQSSFANFPKSAEEAGIQKKVNVMVFHNITKGWIINRNKTGPRTLPCGTPLWGSRLDGTPIYAARFNSMIRYYDRK